MTAKTYNADKAFIRKVMIAIDKKDFKCLNYAVAKTKDAFKSLGYMTIPVYLEENNITDISYHHLNYARDKSLEHSISKGEENTICIEITIHVKNKSKKIAFLSHYSTLDKLCNMIRESNQKVIGEV